MDLSDKVTHSFIKNITCDHVGHPQSDGSAFFQFLGMNMDMGRLRIDPVGLSHISHMGLTPVMPLGVSLFGLQQPSAALGAPT